MILFKFKQVRARSSENSSDQIAPPKHLDAYWLWTSLDIVPWHHLEPTSSRTIFRRQCGVGAAVGTAIAPSIAKTSQFEIASTIAGAVAAATAAPTPQQVHHNIAMHDGYRNAVTL